MRLKSSEIRDIRERMLSEQNGICPLCQTTIHPEEAALDHDHNTGRVRQVLHRACNQAEGRIKSWVNRSRHSGETLFFLKNLVAYLEQDYSENPEHPVHLTKRVKKFSAQRKDDQIETLLEMGVDIPDKATKKDLAALYRKQIK